ncbi:MAG: hypothetical protein RBT76_12250 [candidate division Zixibacteria bacterium]|jgi:hypothetical protein|nr:hypothetical protein [candidate division Zixibacteria bacterium]
MAELSSWDNIREYGLLSTTALLDKFEIVGNQRHSIESNRRPESVRIEHPELGYAVIRDQKPLNEKKLSASLTDMSPQEWYRLLNGMVFFWPSADRLQRLLSGRAYKKRAHCVIVVDSQKLIERYQDSIRLSKINSGAIPYGPTPRGSTTFSTLFQYPHVSRRRDGSVRIQLGEVAVKYGVSDILDFVLEVRRVVPGKPEELIFKP